MGKECEFVHFVTDDLFHGCALTAFVEAAREAGAWPDSQTVRKRAYALYEAEKRRA